MFDIIKQMRKILKYESRKNLFDLGLSLGLSEKEMTVIMTLDLSVWEVSRIRMFDFIRFCKKIGVKHGKFNCYE